MTAATKTAAALKVANMTDGMVLIPSGTFNMGSDAGGDFEAPAHAVDLDEVWIDEALVTNREYLAFVEATDHRTTAELNGKAWGYRDGKYGEIEKLNWREYATDDRADHPVVLVSWFDAVAYAGWAGKRLPTEAEWEKAARGGLENALYPWGDEEADATRTGFARGPGDVPPTSAVRSFPANGYGLFDMVGNVWQWCSDYYGPAYYTNAPANNPKGPWKGSLRARRGGSWNVVQSFRLRCANRGTVDPHTTVPNMGFRCAKDAAEYDVIDTTDRGSPGADSTSIRGFRK